MFIHDPLAVAQVLEDTADLLLVSKRTREQPNPYSEDEHCVMTALVEASTGTDVFIEASMVLQDYCTGLGFEDGVSTSVPAAQWNDATEDDFEVIDTLRHVAKDLRNETGLS